MKLLPILPEENVFEDVIEKNHLDKNSVKLFNAFSIILPSTLEQLVFPIFEDDKDRSKFYTITGGLDAKFSEDELDARFYKCKIFDVSEVNNLYIVANLKNKQPVFSEICTSKALAKKALKDHVLTANPAQHGAYKVYKFKDLLKGKGQMGE